MSCSNKLNLRKGLWEPLIYNQSGRSTDDNRGLHLASQVEVVPVELSGWPEESDSVSKEIVSDLSWILGHPPAVQELLISVQKLPHKCGGWEPHCDIIGKVSQSKEQTLSTIIPSYVPEVFLRLPPQLINRIQIKNNPGIILIIYLHIFIPDTDKNLFPSKSNHSTLSKTYD